MAVIDASSGRVEALWPCGLHPNALLLIPGRGLFPGSARIFVSNGGMNTVSVLDSKTGEIGETLSSAMAPGDLPGSTPASSLRHCAASGPRARHDGRGPSGRHGKRKKLPETSVAEESSEIVREQHRVVGDWEAELELIKQAQSLVSSAKA